MEIFAGLILFIFFVATYFLPTVVGLFRKHNNTLGIFLLNLFLGWTILGWIGALIWSALAQPQKA